MQLIQNVVEWFRSLSNGLKIVVIVVGVVIALLASRAVYVIALLLFVVGLVILVIRAIRRRPLRQWGIVTLSALVLAIVFGNISGASNEGSTPPQRESANSSETAEKTKQEESDPTPEPSPLAPASQEKAEAEPGEAESGEKEQTEEVSIAQIGESVEVDEATWIVTNAQQTSQLNDQFGGITPPKQGNFVIVDFRFKNNSNKAKTLHPGALKLIDKDGRESDPDTDTFSYIPQEKNVFLEQVNPGVIKDAEVIFSVAPGASGFDLQLRGTNLFSLEEPKEVALGF